MGLDTYTRYADDIVFSGSAVLPEGFMENTKSIISDDGWTLSGDKERIDIVPQRLKVHGLLVHGGELRLTKGYRNRIRAYKHLLSSQKIQAEDLDTITGHLSYASQVEKNKN